jgi:antitoxin Phd
VGRTDERRPSGGLTSTFVLNLYDWYNLYMSDVTVSEARERLADVIDEARRQHEPVYLHRRGKRLVAVIDAEDLDRLIELAEDAVDIAEARAAVEEEAESIPWEEVKADLGL